MKTWIQRRPVVAYFTLAFAATWLADFPLVLGKEGLGLLSYSVPLPLYVVLFLLGSFAGPMASAFLVTRVVDGAAGVRAFLRRFVQWRVGLLPWFIVVFAYPLVFIAAETIVRGSVATRALAASPLSFIVTYLPALLVFPALITWGEEPGWRGFALTRLQRSIGPLPASLVVGFLHGVWHLPVFLIAVGPPAMGPFDLAHFASNTGAIMLITIVWTWVFNRARQSILIAVLMHASSNATSMWFARLAPDAPDAVGHWTLIIEAAIALALVLTTRGRLGYDASERVES